MFDYVLDASVIVQWYTSNKELHIKEAIAIRDKYVTLGMRKLVVPDLLVMELISALVKGKGAKVIDVAELITDFYRLGITIVDVNAQIVLTALEIISKSEMTIYDAVYLATAKIYGCKLISDDVKAHGTVKDGSVVMLKDYN